MRLPVTPCHSGVQETLPVPHEAGKAYRLPSSDPTYTTPLATVGEEEKIGAPVAPCHRGVHAALPVPHEAGKAYKSSSADPTYTTPLATAGEETTAPPVSPCHRGVQALPDGQEAGKAYRLPSA